MQSLQKQIGWYKRAQCILGLTIALGLLGFYLLGYRPTTRWLAALQMQIDSKRRDLSADQNRARNLPAVLREVQRLERSVQDYDRQFPRQVELGQFIKDLTQVSQQLSMQELKLQPLASKRADGFYEQPIQLSFQGDFLNVASFLRQVEDLQRLTRIRRLIIKNKTGKPGVVEVTDMVTSVYFSEG
jgi:Tfp pilus assembly protein PilO